MLPSTTSSKKNSTLGLVKRSVRCSDWWKLLTIHQQLETHLRLFWF